METKRNHTISVYVGTVPNSKLKSRKRGEMDTSYTYIDNRSDLYIIRGNGFLVQKKFRNQMRRQEISVFLPIK
jgi:hypothetical protein